MSGPITTAESTPETAVTVERRGHVLLMGLNSRPSATRSTSRCSTSSPPPIRPRGRRRHPLRRPVAHGDHFTGGLDLAEVGPVIGQGDLPFSRPGRRDPWRKDGVWTTPVIAAVQGWTMTLAIELLLAADIRIAAADARFAQMEINRGIYRSARHDQAAARRGLGQCDALAAHRRAIRCRRGLPHGLVQEIVEPGRQLERAVELADAIATKSAPLGVKTTLASAHRARREGEAAAFARLDADMAELFDTDDGHEGLQSFIERREAKFTGR
jgi:enoyl-CoA hydratase/carnithine racemase